MKHTVKMIRSAVDLCRWYQDNRNAPYGENQKIIPVVISISTRICNQPAQRFLTLVYPSEGSLAVWWSSAFCRCRAEHRQGSYCNSRFTYVVQTNVAVFLVFVGHLWRNCRFTFLKKRPLRFSGCHYEAERHADRLFPTVLCDYPIVRFRGPKGPLSVVLVDFRKRFLGGFCLERGYLTTAASYNVRLAIRLWTSGWWLRRKIISSDSNSFPSFFVFKRPGKKPSASISLILKNGFFGQVALVDA